jgi:hypothetical protein
MTSLLTLGWRQSGIQRCFNQPAHRFGARIESIIVAEIINPRKEVFRDREVQNQWFARFSHVYESSTVARTFASNCIDHTSNINDIGR